MSSTSDASNAGSRTPDPGERPPSGSRPTGSGPAPWERPPPWFPATHGGSLRSSAFAPQGHGGHRQREHPQGVTVLVLGILGLVLCPVLAPFAWVMGNTAMGDIDAEPASYSNRGMVAVGRILGIVSTWLTILGVLVLIFFAVVIGFTSPTDDVEPLRATVDHVVAASP